MRPEEEKELVEQAKTDPEAFGKLYDIYYPKIYSYTLRRTADIARSEDIVAEVFYLAFIKRTHFNWRGIPFSAWLYRIANNQIVSHFRNKGNYHVSLDTLMTDSTFELAGKTDIEAEILHLEEELLQHEQFIKMHQQLLTLPVQYQEVLSLKYFENKKLEEISEITGKKLGTVKSLVSRGLEKLRTQQFEPPTVTQSEEVIKSSL